MSYSVTVILTSEYSQLKTIDLARPNVVFSCCHCFLYAVDQWRIHLDIWSVAMGSCNQACRFSHIANDNMMSVKL